MSKTDFMNAEMYYSRFLEWSDLSDEQKTALTQIYLQEGQETETVIYSCAPGGEYYGL